MKTAMPIEIASLRKNVMRLRFMDFGATGALSIHSLAEPRDGSKLLRARDWGRNRRGMRGRHDPRRARTTRGTGRLFLAAERVPRGQLPAAPALPVSVVPPLPASPLVPA